ncbi:MAG: hypothetical protein IKB86_01840 [Clostridia bacterium]|nr:hypothetical protein [Clostridia bacterium]
MFKIKRVLAILLLISIFSFSFVISAQDAMALSLSSASGSVGEQVTLNLILENNSGVAALYVQLDYNTELFTLKSVDDKALLEDFAYADNAGRVVLSWEPATHNNSQSGSLATLTFEINQSVTALGKKEITLTAIENGIIDKDTNVVPCTLSSGSIEIVSPFPEEITSDGLTVDNENGRISKIAAETTAESFLQKIDQNESVKLYTADNKEVNSADFVGTGMILKLVDGETVKRQYVIIVTGDCSGDGQVTITDMLSVKGSILNKVAIVNAYKLAADTNGDSLVTVTDFIQIKAHVLGISSITAR